MFVYYFPIFESVLMHISVDFKCSRLLTNGLYSSCTLTIVNLRIVYISFAQELSLLHVHVKLQY